METLEQMKEIHEAARQVMAIQQDIFMYGNFQQEVGHLSGIVANLFTRNIIPVMAEHEAREVHRRVMGV